MRAYNHLWQIDKWIFREVERPVGIIGDYLHLKRNGGEYKMPLVFVALYVPTNKFFIQINKVNKFLERVE